MPKNDYVIYIPQTGKSPDRIHRALWDINRRNDNQGGTAEEVSADSGEPLDVVTKELRWGKTGNTGQVIRKKIVNGRVVYWHTSAYHPDRRSRSDGSSRLLSPDVADELPSTEAYECDGIDRRESSIKQIKQRRGQQQFRDNLRRRFGDKCLVTGCLILDIIEAAHIAPYLGEHDNHPQNGLLLRADIHTLFDLHLIGIHPISLAIELHPLTRSEYGDAVLDKLDVPADCVPSLEALELRFCSFQKRKKIVVRI